MNTDRLARGLRQLIAELESATGRGESPEPLEAAVDQLQSLCQTLRRQTAKLEAQLQKQFRRVARTADESIRAHPWPTVAAAASIAFLLGLALGHRNSHGRTSGEPETSGAR